MATFAIAGLQLELAAGDNIDELASEIQATKKRFPWIDMVVLGELGAFGVKTENAQPLPGPAEQAFCQAAKDAGIWLIPGTLYERLGTKIFNTAPVIDPSGHVIARYRKMFPFCPYERGIAGGTDFIVFDIPDIGRFGVSICYDMWFPETTRTLAWMGAEVIIHPSLTNTIDREVELSIARSSAATNQCYFFDINVAGRLGYGRSGIFGPGGEIIHTAGAGREVIPVEIDLDHVRRVRERGWHGLGQPLKSFRDTPLTYPPYEAQSESVSLARLGPLELPKSGDSGSGKKDQDVSGSGPSRKTSTTDS